MLPPIGAFMFKLLHFLWLYTTRVPCTFVQRHGRGPRRDGPDAHDRHAILRGIFTKSMPFLRTPKCEANAR